MKIQPYIRAGILDVLKDRNATHSEIVRALHASHGGVSLCLTAMRAAGEIHICEYIVRGYRSMKVYKMGAGIDADKPDNKLAMKERAPALLALLEERGPMQRKDMLSIGWSASTIYSVINFLKTDSKIHIARYEVNKTSHQEVAFYAVGNQPDAQRYQLGRAKKPKPKPPVPGPDQLMSALFGR